MLVSVQKEKEKAIGSWGQVSGGWGSPVGQQVMLLLIWEEKGLDSDVLYKTRMSLGVGAG